MATTVLVSTFPPFPSLTLTLPSETRLADLPSHLPDFIPSFSETDLAFSLPSGSLPLDSTTLGDLWALIEWHHKGSESEEDDGDRQVARRRLINLRLAPRLRGGKGGFGSQLRAAGGRMSSQKTSNNDSCRDLNGRRLSTLKEAKSLAAYLESEPERKKAQQEAQRAKLEKLEKRLGINGKGKEKVDGGDVPVGGKRRFDDTEFIEQSREIADNVRSAVAAGLLKKRKKAKASPSPDPQGAATSTSPASASKGTGGSEAPSNADRSLEATGLSQKTLESPINPPTAAQTSASLTAIGA